MIGEILILPFLLETFAAHHPTLRGPAAGRFGDGDYPIIYSGGLKPSLNEAKASS